MLQQDFFARNVVIVAKELLGKVLYVTQQDMKQKSMLLKKFYKK